MTPWPIASQAPLSKEFSRQEYWSGLSLPSPRDLPNPGIEPKFLHCRQILCLLSHQGRLTVVFTQHFDNTLVSCYNLLLIHSFKICLLL